MIFRSPTGLTTRSTRRFVRFGTGSVGVVRARQRRPDRRTDDRGRAHRAPSKPPREHSSCCGSAISRSAIRTASPSPTTLTTAARRSGVDAAAVHGLGADEQACKPDPVPRRLAARGSATIHLGPPSPAGSSDLPAGSDGPPSNACAAPLRGPLGLAPGGVYRAAPVTRGAGGLLHHRFTLTPRSSAGAVCSLWHCPAGHPGLPLTTTLPCGVRTFLGGTGVPTRPPGLLVRVTSLRPGPIILC